MTAWSELVDVKHIIYHIACLTLLAELNLLFSEGVYVHFGFPCMMSTFFVLHGIILPLESSLKEEQIEHKIRICWVRSCDLAV